MENNYYKNYLGLPSTSIGIVVKCHTDERARAGDESN